MHLLDQQLAEIEELSGLFLTADEIAILLDLDIEAFMKCINNRKGDAYKAYFRGKTKSKKLIRENVVKMARNGSPQAEEMVDGYISAQIQFEKRHNER
jgi:hypothetical protein